MDLDSLEQAKERRPAVGLSAGAEQAILQLKSGGTALASRDPHRQGTVEHPGGTIFVEDMPSLQEVLSKLDVITAVIDRPEPQFAAVEGGHHDDGTRVDLTPAAVFAIGGIPVSVTLLGLWMLLSGIVSAPVIVNPYISLFLFLGGLVLAVTAWLGLSKD